MVSDLTIRIESLDFLAERAPLQMPPARVRGGTPPGRSRVAQLALPDSVEYSPGLIGSSIPMTRFPQEFIEFANGFKGVTETVLVAEPIVPNSYNFFNVEPLPPRYGQRG